MDLEEISYSPFTTSTTCYSSSPCAAINRGLPFRFATENHVLGLSRTSKVPCTYGIVPRDNSSVICVGYARYPSAKGGIDPVQVLALVDPTLIEQPEDQPPTLPYSTTWNAQESPARDDFSVVSTSQSTVHESGSRTNSRRPSMNSNTAAASQLDASIKSVALEEEQGTPIVTNSPIQAPKARLILQVPTENLFPTPDHIAFLDFRPLSPCIVKWREGSFAVFVGSADDCLVRMYEPVQGLLIRREGLPEEYFGIETPVMGIDFYTDGESNTLGMVGQDGTIRLVTWKSSTGWEFEQIVSHTVIVDGPLASLQFQPRNNGDLRVIVGSLCGYVCHLTRHNSEWGGPKMVVQSLWNNAIQDEDSVLAVNAFGDCVVVGTLSGRVLVFKASMFGEDYHLSWECTLPYSIHGLDVSSTDDNDFELMVLTRRSIHMFRPKKKFSLSLSRSKYDPSAAKTKLQARLRHLQEKQQEKICPNSSSSEQDSSASVGVADHMKDSNQSETEKGEADHHAETKYQSSPQVTETMGEMTENRSILADKSGTTNPEKETKKGEFIMESASTNVNAASSIACQTSIEPDLLTAATTTIDQGGNTAVAGDIANDEEWVIVGEGDGEKVDAVVDPPHG